jgi:hypothetical protein
LSGSFQPESQPENDSSSIGSTFSAPHSTAQKQQREAERLITVD